MVRALTFFDLEFVCLAGRDGVEFGSHNPTPVAGAKVQVGHAEGDLPDSTLGRPLHLHRKEALLTRATACLQYPKMRYYRNSI
jgi:hypothetical protein